MNSPLGQNGTKWSDTHSQDGIFILKKFTKMVDLEKPVNVNQMSKSGVTLLQ